MTPTLLKCAAVVLAAAITATAENPEPARSLSARLVLINPDSEVTPDLFVPTGKEEEFSKCAPGLSVESPPAKFAVGADDMIVFTKTAASDQVVAKISVPPGLTEAILFFLKKTAADGTEAYQVCVVDEALKALPKGGSHFLNLTSRKLKIAVGDMGADLAPGSATVLQRPANRNEFNMALVNVQIQEDGGMAKLKESILRFTEAERYFVVTYLEGANVPMVKIYKQTVTSEDAGTKRKKPKRK